MSLATGEMFKHLSNVEGAVCVDGERLLNLQYVLRLILIDVLEVAQSNNISLTASGGVCLGAIRHEGFIPWDDDIDINIARCDLDRFMNAIEERFPGKYWTQTPQGTKNYALGIARLRLKGTTLKTRDDFNDEDGVFVDLFILDDAPDNALLRKIHGSISLALGLISSSRRFAEHASSYLAITQGDASAVKTVKKKILIGHLFGFRSSDSWTKTWDRWNAKFQNGNTNYLTIPGGRKHYFGELYRREDFFPVSYGEFEGLRIPLPANPAVYMTALYGPDYMTPPPEAERETHVVLSFDLGSFTPNYMAKDV